MIPLDKVRKSFEKNAKAPVSLLKGVGKGIEFIGRHPWYTLGAIGTAALASKIHPLHQMFREETKNIILKDQNKILNEILRSSKKEVTAKPKKQKLIIPSLT